MEKVYRLRHAVIFSDTWRSVAARFGAGVASLQNLVDGDAMVLGGGLGTRLGQLFVERIAAAAQPHVFVDDRPPAFVLTELGDDGDALGPALLALEGDSG